MEKTKSQDSKEKDTSVNNRYLGHARTLRHLERLKHVVRNFMLFIINIPVYMLSNNYLGADFIMNKQMKTKRGPNILIIHDTKPVITQNMYI